MDLILVIASTIILIPAVIFVNMPLQIVLGLPFVLFFPGYTLIAALFPGKSNLDSTERVALSVGASLVVVPLMGLILNYTSWGITPTSVLFSNVVLIVTMTTLAVYRRKSVPEKEQFKFIPHLNFHLRIGQGFMNRFLTLTLVFSLCVSFVLVVYMIAIPKLGEKFTEFYILGEEGKAAEYTQRVVLGEQVEVTVGVGNQEHEQATYVVVVLIDGEKVEELDPINLASGETEEMKCTFIPGKAGPDQRVDLLLYKSGMSQPYRALQLWISVETPG